MRATDGLAVSRSVVLCAVLACGVAGAATPDKLCAVSFTHDELGGVIDERISQLIENHYLKQDAEGRWLSRFSNRTGITGNRYEGLGKLIDAGARFQEYAKDARVRELTQRLVDGLVKTHDADGYIGFWAKEARDRNEYVNWTIHEQEYILLAFVHHYQATGDVRSLEAAKCMADYLIGKFPTKENGIAAQWDPIWICTAGLPEAFLALHQVDPNPRWLDFAANVRHGACSEVQFASLRTWNQDFIHPPIHVYVMTARCNAQLDLYRVTGEKSLMDMSRKLYGELFAHGCGGMLVTGSSSEREHFTYDQSGAGDIGESCVTAYVLRWLDGLMRIDGRLSYGDAIERTMYNALFAAMSPDGRRIRYFTPFSGPREYDTHDDGFCCCGNFRRAMSELPRKVCYATADEGLAVNLYAPFRKTFRLGGVDVPIACETDYPNDGRVTYAIGAEATFPLWLRVPRWCPNMTVRINGEDARKAVPDANGAFCVRRSWHCGDRVTVDMPMSWRIVRGRAKQAGRVALLRGPMVYCIGTNANAAVLSKVGVPRDLVLDPASIGEPERDDSIRPNGRKVRARAWLSEAKSGPAVELTLTEFADPSGIETYFKVAEDVRGVPLQPVDDELFDQERKLPFGDAGHDASVTWRLGTPVVKDDDFLNLLDFFKRHRLTGKLSFFIATSHTPAKLELIRQQTEPVARRLRQLREAGYPAGVNPLCTLGHVDEGLDMCVDIHDAMRFTNVHGQSAKGNFCPSDPVWREKYVKPFYEIVARMKPDFIYTDDDIRLLWHSVPGKGCFCDRCMERIRKHLDYTGDRAGLEAWFADPVQGEGRKRRLLQYNRELLADLYAYIAGVIHGVDPKVPVGAMDCCIGYHGYAFEEIYRQLSRYGNDVYWRPGGGYYNDNTPDQSIIKANCLASECAYLPTGVAKVEAEVENFNYQRLNKSIHMTAQEALLYIAAGCRGVAWNVFPSTDFDVWSASDRLAEALEALRPTMDAAVRACGTARPKGVWNGLGRDAYVAHSRGKANWFDDGGAEDRAFLESKLQKIGIPAAYREEDCIVWAPSVDAVWSLETNTIARLLAGGTYLSAEAAAALVERGFGTDIGFVPDGVEPGFTNERLTDHPLTTGMVGMMRDGRKSFWGGTVTRLKPQAGAKVMSETVGDRNVLVTPCVSGTFENARGGRVFVTGYYPWSRLFYRHTTDCMKRVFRWLSRDRLSMVGSFHRTVLWQRGERALALYNASLDRADGLELLLPKGLASKLKVTGTDTVVAGDPDVACFRFKVPPVEPWSVAFYELAK